MEWIEPKTDWVSTDYFNAEDYNRIKNNIGHLKSLTDKLFSGFNWALGYNLIPYPHFDTTKTVNGVTCTDNGDGTITLNGTVTAITWYVFVQKSKEFCDYIKQFDVLTLSDGIPTTARPAWLYVFAYDKSGSTIYSKNVPNTGNANIKPASDWYSIAIGIYIPSGAVLDNLTFKPMLVRGSEPMEFHPYYETMPNATSDLIVVDKEKNCLSLIYAREINNIEKSLETLNVKTYKLNIGETKEYLPNTRTIDFVELNRLESATLLLYRTMVAHKNALPRLAFTLGGQKGIRV